MDILYYFYHHPLLSAAQTAFMIWMLVDAYRRGAEFFWYWIILLVPVVGAWAYFFAVKFGDYRGLQVGSLFQRRASLDELRFRAEQTPTLSNRVALAQRLIERGEHAGAVPFLEAALQQETDHATALYSLAVCHKEASRFDQAVPLLEKVLAHDPSWSNYRAWHLLIEVRGLSGDPAGALEHCQKLARIAPMLQHQCLLAEHLVAAGQHHEARIALERSLQTHAYAPGYVRRRDRRWASQAKRLHKQLAAKG